MAKAVEDAYAATNNLKYYNSVFSAHASMGAACGLPRFAVAAVGFQNSAWYVTEEHLCWYAGDGGEFCKKNAEVLGMETR